MSARLSLLWASAQRARLLRTLLMLCAALLFGGVLLSIEWLRVARAVQAADSEQAALLAAESDAGALRMLTDQLAAREVDVRRLVSLGFTAPADRVAWVEGVSAAARAEQPLRYKIELGADTPLALPAEVQAWYDARGLAAPRQVANELTLDVQGLHEDELRRVLARSMTAGGALVRLERCVIERRADRIGLDAVCTLSRRALLFAPTGGGRT